MPSARKPQRLHGARRPDLVATRGWIGNRATDADGRGIGRVEDVWVDADTGEPAWLLIRDGRFGGGNQHLVPFDGATGGGGRVWLPHSREMVRSSPNIGTDQLLTAELGDQLRDHYAAATPSRRAAALQHRRRAAGKPQPRRDARAG